MPVLNELLLVRHARSSGPAAAPHASGYSCVCGAVEFGDKYLYLSRYSDAGSISGKDGDFSLYYRVRDTSISIATY